MDLQTVLTALRNADAAGNVEDARRLAQIADRLSRSAASPLDDEISRLEQEREEIRSRKFKPETTFGGNVKEFFKGIVPGAVGLAETAGTGISALLPDETEKSVRGKIKEYAEAAKKPFEAGEGYEESVGRKLGEGLGSTLPFFAAGPLGVAGRVGAAGVGVAAGAGEAREAAEAKGVTGSDRATATLLGAPTGLLDILAPEIKPFKGMITTALARGGVEGATEAAQKISQNLIAKGVYDPQQEILVGSGEEGAYGAGVGALASLILDMTLGRKARGAKPGAKPGAEPGAELPPSVAAPTAERPQGELFPAELDQAQRELDSVMGPPRPAPEPPVAQPEQTAADMGQQSLFEGEAGPSELETTQPDLFGELLPQRERAPEEVTPEPSKRDDRTRDMIDELETSQIEEMVSKDTSAELRSLLDKEQERVDRIRASASQRRYDKEQKEQAERLAILLPIIESPAQPNIPKVFVQTLKREGFANLKLTERERNLINRAYDIRLAEEPAPEIEPSAPAENAAMEAAIPERTSRNEPTSAANAGANAAPTGAGTTGAKSVAPQPTTTERDTAAGRAEAPKPAGVGAAGQPANVAGVGEGSKPRAVKGPTDLQKREAFGKAIGAVQPYPGTLRGRVNLSAQRAAANGDFPGVVSALKNSKNATVSEIAKRAEGLNTKIAVDDEAAETYVGKSAIQDQLSIDGAKMHLDALGKIRELAPKVDALPDGARLGFDLPFESIKAFNNGKEARSISLGEIADMGHSMFAPLPTGPLKLRTKEDFKALQKAYEDLTAKYGEEALQLTATASAVRTGVAGVYDAESDTIRVPEYASKREEVLAHELVHAQTVKAIASPTIRQKPVVARLNKLYAHVKQELANKAQQDKHFEAPYGLQSVQEFVAEGMANPKFQYELTQIKYANTSAWDSFVQAIADLLGIKNDTAFTELLSIYSELSTTTGTEAPPTPKKPKFTAQEMLERAEAAQRKADEEAAKAEKKTKAEAPAEKKAKPEEQKAKVEAPAEKKAEPTSDNAYVLAKEQGEGAHAIRTLAADAYLNSAEDYSVKRAEAMIKDLEDGKVPELKFGKNNSNGPGTGGKYAKAFYESLSADEKAQFNKELQSFLYSEIRSKQYMEAYNKSQELARAEVEGDASELIKDANVMATALHPEVVRMLKANDLLGALRFVAGQKLGRASDVANALADKLQGVDVEIADFKNPPGILQRLFDRQPDAQNAPGIYAITKQGKRVIFLDSNTGLDTWALLHEATHGAADATLDNPSHPLTKQLTQLFNDVKDSLDTSYGATDVKEFAAEAFSNPGFQRKLAAINPKGEKITAWQRFVHAVKNFLRSIVGMPTKGMESALDSADYMIEAIVNGHAGTSGSLGTVSLLNRGSALFEAMGERAKSLPRLDDEKAAQINELYVRAKASVRNVIRQSLPLNALVEVAQKYIPMAPKLDTLIGERSGAENKRNQMIEPVINRVEGWAKSNPDKLDAFNRVVYQSTLGQVDPSKPRSDYAGKMDDSGNKKDAAWDELQKDWRSLGADGQSVYKQMRDTYEKMYSEVRDVLNARIDNALEDPDTRKKVKAEIYQRLFSKGSIEPYFPLTRSGKYWLSYSLGGEFFVEAYETSYMRDKAVQELGTEGATDVQKFANLNQINYRKAPATSFVNNVLRTLEANKVNANVTEEVMRLFLNTLPETSFAQAFRRRKGTLGFDHDAIGALRSKTFNLSRQLSNMEYGAKLEKLRQTMEEYVRSQGNKDEAVEMMNELSARIDYAISPNVPKWSKLATSFGFNMTLGLNVSSALVNLSQIPLVVAPYLGGKYGVADTAKAIGRATKYFVGSGFDRESTMLVPTDKGEKKVKVRAFPSMDNYDFTKADAPKHLKVLSEVAGERGQLNRSQIYDTLEVGEDTSLMTKVNAVTGFVFHHGERMNRQVALIAAYELELDRLKQPTAQDKGAIAAAEKTRLEELNARHIQNGKSLTAEVLNKHRVQAREDAPQIVAADYAVYVTELTNGGTAAAAAPRIAQGAIGKVVFMYKRYGVSMYYMLFKTARDALKSADPEVRTAAKRQIAGIYASAALMAGVQGIPMFGIASMLYNLILKDDDEEDFDTLARKWMGEGAYSGALNALTGLEISGRIGLADLLFRDTNTKPSDSVMLSLMETLGGPVFGVASRIERGLKLIGDGNVERGIEQIMPSAIGNALKSIRFATEGANTLRGDPITGDLGYWNPFAQFFGFAPAEYTRQLEINSALKNIERTALEEKTNLLRKYYVATRVGDSDAAADILDKMLEHNRKFPGSAITASTIKKSMEQHRKTSAEMYHGVTLNKSLRPQLLANAAEYEDENEDEE